MKIGFGLYNGLNMRIDRINRDCLWIFKMFNKMAYSVDDVGKILKI